MRRRILLCALGCLLGPVTDGSGAAAAPQAPRAATTTRGAYNGWPDAFRLGNGTAEVIVVPSIGRIMRFGFIDGPNVLWENTFLLGKTAEPARAGGDWQNFGGDKIWPWPQGEWGHRTGRGWPPPTGADQAPYQAVAVRPGLLRLTSPIVAGYGVRVVRDIELAETGARLTIRSRLVKVRDGAAFPVAAWSVTQMPVPDVLFARPMAGTTLENGVKPVAGDDAPWKSIRRENGVLILERPTARSSKLFFDADLLAWAKGDTLFTQRPVAPVPPISGYEPGDRAQIFSLADDPANPSAAYVELEMTSPRRTLAKGEMTTLDVVWELHRLKDRQRSPVTIAAFLTDL